MGRIADRLEGAAAYALIGGMLRLPYKTRVRLMGRVMARAVGPLAGWRARAEANIGHIWLDTPASERAQIVSGALDNFGRTLIENYSGAESGGQLERTTPEGNGLPDLAKAKADGRPVIFVTGHIGNHEAPRRVLTRLGYKVGGLYRPMRNPHVNARYAETMSGLSGPVFPQGTEGTRGLLRHLRDGGMATLLFDVYDANGAEFPFLGQPAKTALSAAEIALKYDALLIPYFGIRSDNGLDFEVQVDAPIPHTDPLTMMMEATAALEARIHAHPDQWFWVHRRWKPFFGL